MTKDKIIEMLRSELYQISVQQKYGGDATVVRLAPGLYYSFSGPRSVQSAQYLTAEQAVRVLDFLGADSPAEVLDYQQALKIEAAELQRMLSAITGPAAG